MFDLRLQRNLGRETRAGTPLMTATGGERPRIFLGSLTGLHHFFINLVTAKIERPPRVSVKSPGLGDNGCVSCWDWGEMQFRGKAQVKPRPWSPDQTPPTFGGGAHEEGRTPCATLGADDLPADFHAGAEGAIVPVAKGNVWKPNTR